MALKCPKCGNDLLDGAAFCSSCGCNIAENTANKPKIKRITVLLIILGGLVVLIFLLVGISLLTQPRISTPSSSSISAPIGKNKEIEDKIEDALRSHAITDYCEFVSVTIDGTDANIGVSLQWYESYSFIAAVTVATECIEEIKGDYGLTDVFLMVYTPDAKYKATWSSTDLKKGKLSDTQKNFDSWYTLKETQALYGYEGLLED